MLSWCLKTFQVALQQMAVAISKVHSVSFTILEEFAFGAVTVSHPFTVAVHLKTVFPDIHEVILINIALMIVAPNTGAC